MRLADTNISIFESRFIASFPIIEDGEGLRWKFGYDRWQHDSSPDALVLGAYRHPRTGNNLVGAINLNYLDARQLDDLRKALPRIMAGANLYNRYHLGRRLVPDVFDNYYRTYNSKFIRGVDQDTLFPKYGYIKATKDWIKKKLGGLFKPRAQRQREAEPQYPTDLANMRKQLDQTMQQLQQHPPPPEEVPPEAPEMQAARNAFLKYRDQQQMGEIERAEDEPLQQAQQNYHRQQLAQQQPELFAGEPEEESPLPPETPDEKAAAFAQEQEANRRKLMQPGNELDLTPEGEMVETIRYYSPRRRQYLMEVLDPHPADLAQQLWQLRPAMAQAAQVIYDSWDQDDEYDDFGGGGICDAVADAIGDILVQHGIDYTMGGHEGDDHAYVVAYDKSKAFIVDIPCQLYERGGGYSWVKQPEVVFTPEHIVIEKTDRPDWINELD